MSILYIDEDSANISLDSNRIVINYHEGDKRYFPIETIESISIMGQSQISSTCIIECLKRNIPIVYFSKGGKCYL